MDEKEGFVVSCNEAQDEWYIVHRQMKGSVLHREILAERYPTEEDATEAMIIMIEASR